MNITGRDLLDLTAFGLYRKLAELKQYGGPMVPAVGEKYGNGLAPKVVYCGVATRELYIDTEQSVNAAYENAIIECQKSFDEVPASNNKNFWRFGLDIATTLAEDIGISLADQWNHFAWTNISKLCDGTNTAPPDDDMDLRKLDVAQIRKELSILKPDLFICVSGMSLVSTGNEIFGDAPGQKISTGNLSSGGKFIWTEHPARKSIEWRKEIIDLIKQLLR